MADQGISKPRARSQHGRILGIWGLFWCPFTHTLCFIARVENKDRLWTLHDGYNLSICILRSQNLQIHSNRRCASGALVLDPPLVIHVPIKNLASIANIMQTLHNSALQFCTNINEHGPGHIHVHICYHIIS